MPFTFSHPAIILPLKVNSKGILSLTGLVIGSITPDFEYFIRMKVSVCSHSFWGMFWFDLPLGLLLTFVYHHIVRDPLITNLPQILNEKLTPFKTFKWTGYFNENWPIVILSVLIGAASHLFWVAFTHPKGYFVGKIRLLQRNVIILKYHVHVFSILQQASSIIGGAIVIWAIFSLKSVPSDQSGNKAPYWLFVSFITMTIFIIRVFIGLNFHLYGDMIVTAISAFLIGIIVTPLIAGSFIKHPSPKTI